MEGLGKKIIIFVVLMLIFIGLFNVVFRYLLPINSIKFNSNSMLPTYHKGDILFYTESNSYQVDEVIVVSTKMAPISHRIIEINTDGTYKTKGDNNPESIKGPYLDETKITNDQIMGKVISSIRGFIFYPIVYGLEIIIALLLTKLIYSKLRK